MGTCLYVDRTLRLGSEQRKRHPATGCIPPLHFLGMLLGLRPLEAIIINALGKHIEIAELASRGAERADKKTPS